MTEPASDTQPSAGDLVDDEAGRFWYRLKREDDDSLVARFADIEGFFVGGWEPVSHFEPVLDGWSDPLTITVVNPELDPVLAEAGAEEVDLGNLYLDVLDRSGHTIGSYWLSSATLEEVTRSSTSVDHAMISAWVVKHPHHAAKAVWEQWRTGPPTEPGLWAELSGDQRQGWLEVVGEHHFAVNREFRDTPRTEVVLDGRFVTDLAGFFCAVGEAVNGPGGYYGWNLYALLDCLGHGFGTEGDFTLVWEHSEVAREHLATVAEPPVGPVSYFDTFVSCFRERGKEVVLR